jgi:hypothetical protein
MQNLYRIPDINMDLKVALSPIAEKREFTTK